MSTITYTAPEASDIGIETSTVEVLYRNESGHIHTRSINVPRKENGSVDEEYYREILDGQLCGVENKIKVGVIQFIDPNTLDESANENDLPPE